MTHSLAGSSQIGQVMLALPNALANTGMRAGVPLLFVYSLFSMFTIHLLTALYAEYKARKVGSLLLNAFSAFGTCQHCQLALSCLASHAMPQLLHNPDSVSKCCLSHDQEDQWFSVSGCFWILLVAGLQVKAGKWEGGHNKKATQYFDVITELVGFWPGRFVLLITIISLCSTGIAQVIACSTGAYYLKTSISKR